jgi:hypothetical protein
VIREFEGRSFDVIDFDDVDSGEHVIEFRDVEDVERRSLVAVVVPDGGDWNEALISCNPDFEVISVRLMQWVIAIAQERLDR